MNARGERILIFGDSLTHPGQDGAPAIQAITQDTNRATSAPGDLLGSILLEQGAAAVQTDAKVGRSALSFWQAEPTAQLVAADQAFAPTKVIVMLGTNDASRDPAATEQAMARLRDTYKGMGAEMWAVGPMTYAGSGASLNAAADAIFAAMQRVFGKAQTIDARPLSAGLTQLGVDRAGDGIHFTQAGARQLAPQIASALLVAKPASMWPKIALITGGGLALGAIVWALGQRFTSGEGVGDDRAIARKSYQEEEQAIRAYGQRLTRAEDPRLKRAITHARGEEALPKIADAEEQGRLARGRRHDEERKKLVAEEREAKREYDWMKR